MNFDDLPDFSGMTRREIEDYLVERALVEPDFRSRLLAAPEAVLRELGLPVGEGVKIHVIEEEPKSFVIVLPRVLRELDEPDENKPGDASGGIATGAIRFFKGYA